VESANKLPMHSVFLLPISFDDELDVSLHGIRNLNRVSEIAIEHVPSSV